ncbi:hypothetical protein BC835DRAFT_793484 [Cytidiella melzeri]|nr:hypothetical protein BC835DRAFT_793484 [Cytidiella melzeri]
MSLQPESMELPSGFAIMQTLSHQYDVALAALAYLQGDIYESFQKTVRQVQAARNAASPILKLPIEVYRQVFMCLEGDVRDKFAVSQTCSLWRRISTQDPFLWTNIDLDTIRTSEIASKVFRRAGEYPLRLRCNNWNELRLNCVSFEMPRVEELETVFTGTIPMFRNLCRRSAPQLKRFVIAVPSHNHEVTYIPCLFSKLHPMLTDLTMVECRLLFTPENYRGLTKLHIRFSFPIMSQRQDDDFLCVFRGCPDLEEVRLENLNLSHDGQQPTEILHLPRLRIMHLRLCARDLNCLLSAISTPPTLELTIILYGLPAQRGAILGAITSPGLPSLALLQETKYLDIDQDKHGIFAFRDQGAREPSLSYTALTHDLASQFTGTSDDLVILTGLHPMPHLERVRARNIKPGALIKLLTICPTITKLELIHSTGGVGNTTTIPFIMRELPLSTSPLLPHLQTLLLENVYIDVETLFSLVELRRARPEFRHIALHNCQGDLSLEESMETLNAEFQTARWTRLSSADTEPLRRMVGDAIDSD